MNKIVNGVANDYEFPQLEKMIEPLDNWIYIYKGNRSYGKSYIQSLLDKKDKEIERLNNEIKILKQNNVNEILRDDLVLCTKQYKKSEEKLEKANKKIDRLNNIIKQIEEIILNHYIVGHKVQNASLDMILNEIKELKENK